MSVNDESESVKLRERGKEKQRKSAIFFRKLSTVDRKWKMTHSNMQTQAEISNFRIKYTEVKMSIVTKSALCSVAAIAEIRQLASTCMHNSVKMLKILWSHISSVVCLANLSTWCATCIHNNCKLNVSHASSALFVRNNNILVWTTLTWILNNHWKLIQTTSNYVRL